MSSDLLNAVPSLTDADRQPPTTSLGSSGLRELSPVEGVLDDLDGLLSRFVAFPSIEARHAVVCWVVHCHAIEAFDSTPRLAAISPEKGSGKTRLLEVLNLVVPSPMHAVNMSAAALFRVVAQRQPTLLFDEADTYLGPMVAKNHEDLRGLINAGHRRGAMVHRCDPSGSTMTVVEFPAFAACALAGIGDLPDTILDRSILITMRRRAPGEHVEPFRERVARPETEPIRERLARWAADNSERLTEAWPVMPAGIVDRAADVWEPLLAVADAVGEHWPERIRHAAVVLNNARAERGVSLGVQLLADCRRVFTEVGTNIISSQELVEGLNALIDAPWGDLRGKPLDARGLAARLRPYEVRPGDHRFEVGTLKGYRAENFHDAWSRYLTPVADDVADD